MKAFNCNDFILETETAKHLYHDYAAKLPLVDYHCHLNPKEIWEDRRFDNIVEVWLGGRNPDGTYAASKGKIRSSDPTEYHAQRYEHGAKGQGFYVNK